MCFVQLFLGVEIKSNSIVLFFVGSAVVVTVFVAPDYAETQRLNGEYRISALVSKGLMHFLRSFLKFELF